MSELSSSGLKFDGSAALKFRLFLYWKVPTFKRFRFAWESSERNLYSGEIGL